MLAELVHHVVGVDPDRDWITLAVVDARTPASSPKAASPPPLTVTTTPSTSSTATASRPSGQVRSIPDTDELTAIDRGDAPAPSATSPPRQVG